MANPLSNLLFGPPRSDLVEVVAPRRTFADVILPEETREALRRALVQIEKHDLLFHQWGLGERHPASLGLAFNFAGPPGTGKTICAEALAHALDRKLMVVRYDEMESMWAGNTGKNVAAVFRFAESQNAVLFFDEADAIAGRRFTSLAQGYQREANTVVSVLLRELEVFSGVVIFATNLAANFDPAFERRIRTHILFEMPAPAEREQIWRAQLHATKTPLAADVDFTALAQQYPASGGDIQNAVLKAAQMAIAEPGADADKQIHQRHFAEGMKQVVEARRVMEQSIFNGGNGDGLPPGLADWLRPGPPAEEKVRGQLEALQGRLEAAEDEQQRLREALAGELVRLGEQLSQDVSDQLGETAARWQRQLTWLQYLLVASLALAACALGLAFLA